MLSHVTLVLLSILLTHVPESRPQDNPFSKHEFYSNPKFPKLPQNDLEMLFKTLDRNNNGKLEKSDLLASYENPRAAADIDKFLQEVDSDHDEHVVQSEFENFMSDQSAVFGVAECKYRAMAQRVRLECYQDALLNYVHAMMPFDEVVQLFKAFDIDGDNQITLKDVDEAIPKKNEDTEESLTFRQNVLNNILEEWGNDDMIASFAEFKSYVRHVDLLSMIKLSKHDINRYMGVVVQYTTFYLTELDIWKVFQTLDEGHDGVVDQSELRTYTTYPASFLDAVGIESKERFNHEELRIFMKKILIKHILQETCRKEVFKNGKVKCFVKSVFEVLRYAYKFAKIYIPSSNVIYLFEMLDSNSDGEIKDNDLATSLPDKAQREKFLQELDSNVGGSSVTLQEFRHFLSFPSTIYALSECLFLPDAEETECFAKSLLDFIAKMMPTSQVKPFFDSYTIPGSQKITKFELEQVVPSLKNKKRLVELYIKKLGLGDEEVTYFEFCSYVRHQDLRDDFDRCESEGKDPKEKIKLKQDVLLQYIENRLTEYDIETVFDMFDSNKDGEVNMSDLHRWYESEAKCRKFLAEMDTEDGGDNIDFAEFRHYMIRPEIRKVFEEVCTYKIMVQEEEITCIFEKFWSMVTTQVVEE